MLGKLMKYELKWTTRFLFPLYIILAFVTIIGRFLISIANFDTDLSKVIFSIFILGYILSILSISIGTFIIVMVRFYKNMMTEEGYLMFTLPVKVSTHILAKGIIASLWTLISIGLTCVSVYLLFSGNREMVTVFHADMSEIYMELKQLFGSKLVVFITEIVLSCIVSTVFGVLYIYVSIAIGQLISKNKILGSVAAYIVISMIIQFISVIGMVVFGLFNMDEIIDGNNFAMLNTYMLLLIIISFVMSIAFFYITNRILSRKLNLE